MRKYLSAFILLGSIVAANAQQVSSIVGPNKEVDPYSEAGKL